MTDTELKRLVKTTVKWADELSEQWTGTTTGGMIEYQKKHVKELMASNDLNLVSVAVLELAQICDQVEKESDGYS